MLYSLKQTNDGTEAIDDAPLLTYVGIIGRGATKA